MKAQSQTGKFKWWTSPGILGVAIVCLVAGWLFALDDPSTLIRTDALVASITFGVIAAYTAICQMAGWEVPGFRILRAVAKIAIGVWPAMFVCLAVFGISRGDYWSVLGYFILTTFYVGFPAFLILGFVDRFKPGTTNESNPLERSGRNGN